jgi:hypothetical protein
MEAVLVVGVVAAVLATGLALPTKVEPGLGLQPLAADGDTNANVKLIGAAIFSVVALVLAIVVIAGKSYSADDKKAAWALITFVGGFWLGKSS